MNSRKQATITILIAVSVATNYAMVSLPNVKLMDLIVFVGGFCFGPFVGSFIGITSWIVYGTLNPRGFSLPIWISTMLSEPIYGIAGALLRKRLNPYELGEVHNDQFTAYGFLGILAMFLTFVYDLITNIVFGYVNNWNILFAVIFGFVPFGLVHMLSNAFFFSIGAIPTIKAILNVTGGENSGIYEK